MWVPWSEAEKRFGLRLLLNLIPNAGLQTRCAAFFGPYGRRRGGRIPHEWWWNASVRQNNQIRFILRTESGETYAEVAVGVEIFIDEPTEQLLAVELAAAGLPAPAPLAKAQAASSGQGSAAEPAAPAAPDSAAGPALGSAAGSDATLPTPALQPESKRGMKEKPLWSELVVPHLQARFDAGAELDENAAMNEVKNLLAKRITPLAGIARAEPYSPATSTVSNALRRHFPTRYTKPQRRKRRRPNTD
jgi:hypothetical protein